MKKTAPIRSDLKYIALYAVYGCFAVYATDTIHIVLQLYSIHAIYVVKKRCIKIGYSTVSPMDRMPSHQGKRGSFEERMSVKYCSTFSPFAVAVAASE